MKSNVNGMPKLNDPRIKSFMDRTSPASKKAMLSGSGLILLFLAFCIIVPAGRFYASKNIINLLQQVVTYSIIGYGLTFCLISGGTDLSAGSAMALSGIVMVMLLSKGVPIPIAILLCLLVGVLTGIINGFSIEILGVVPFIATLGTQWVFRGFANRLVDGKPLYVATEVADKSVQEAFYVLGGGKIPGSFPLPYSVIITLVLGVILYFVLAKTRLGRQIYACGSNLEAAKLSGINAVRTRMFAYCISGVCAAICGILVTSRINSAQPMAGQGYELEAIAASVVGGVSNTGGEGTIVNTVIGALIMGVLRNGLNLVGTDSYTQNMLIGVILVGACALEVYRNRRRGA